MDFDQFLKEVAPWFGLQWGRFRRRGVKRRVERRIDELGLSNFGQYFLRVKGDERELNRLSEILTVTISRFFRDREVFDAIETSVIPAILKQRAGGEWKIWSIGCASGEEPYTLSLVWKEKFEKNYPEMCPCILSTDIDENLIKRAREGRYRRSSLKEVPEEILHRYFEADHEFYILAKPIREKVQFRRHDVLHEGPFSEMDLVFCRNLAFTYFSKERQIEVLRKIAASIRGPGYLVIGKDESLPLVYPTLFVSAFPKERIYQKFLGYATECPAL